MEPPLSCEEFLNDCGRLLSEEDLSDIKKIFNEVGTTRNDLLKEWIRFIDGFKNEAAWFRANELHKDPMDHIRGDRIVEPFVMNTLIEASKAGDPLIAEKLLAKAKWKKLDDLAVGHYFDFESLIIYAIKLKILERFKEIGSENGSKIFKQYKEKAVTLQGNEA